MKLQDIGTTVIAGGGDIIQCDDLLKVFGEKRAVDELTLRIRRGEIYGFLGPNGAGKTTTVRMLTTMERPTAGRVSINGYDTRDDYLMARRNIGVIQQQNSLDKDISKDGCHPTIEGYRIMEDIFLRSAKKFRW